MYYQSFVQFVVLILAITRTETTRPYTIELLDGNLTVLNWDTIKSLNYKIFEQKMIYVDFTLRKTLSKFDIKLNFDFIKKDNRRGNVLKLTLDGCGSLEGAQKAKFLKILYREIFRVTNVPKRCPILPDKLYYFNNYTIKDDDFPILTPAMVWQLNGDFIIDKKVFVAGILKGRVRKL